MYKVLLVDDNKREVNAVADSINWVVYDAEIIGIAANGREALEVIENLQPDIVLTDIVMPAMNGVELAQELNIRYPSVKTAFLTYHDDFHYVKSAVDLNVEGYLLKPVNPAELIVLLEKIITKLDIEYRRIAEHEQLEKQLAALKAGNIYTADDKNTGIEEIPDVGIKKVAQLANTIKNIIHAHYQENLSVQEIAETIFYSSRQANIIFRKETGFTIYDYLVYYRMEIAKKLLKETDMKITAIIREVGYTNNSHFTLTFKRSTGMTPSEYRNKI